MAWKTDISQNKLTESEIGTVWKRWKGQIKVALAYPNTYHVGMSNLGFHTVYRLLNSLDNVLCERIFLPHEGKPGAKGIISLESQKPLSAFDIVAFSISFENDYPNLLAILKQASLPLRSEDRNPLLPLVIAGGVACLLNPEPISSFIDCFLIGEAEPLLPSFIEKFDPKADRQSWLRHIARYLPGIYVPRFYKAKYKTTGVLSTFYPIDDVPEKIIRVIQNDTTASSACSAVLTPHTTFDQTYLMEVSRGCPHGCRFCAAGYIFRPPRFRPLIQLEKSLQKGASLTQKVGLVGAAVSDHPQIGPLCNRATEENIRLSFSSLRADAITPELISALKNSGAKTATIAPDAGSDRMRRVINKGIAENDIFNASETLVANGIPNLKLYFMVGLPTETMDDIEAIIALCKRIKHHFLKSSRARKRIGEITVSVNSFVPKPATPFQWTAMDEVDLLKQKIKRIKQGLRRIPNIRINSDIPRWAYIQGLLSRGDRKVNDLLLLAHQNRGNWPKTLNASPVNTNFYVYREREVDELLPWDFIDHGIKKAFLIREYEKAKSRQTTAVCQPGCCTVCGVCEKDFRF
jgi:radical SAM family uncharacterized protein